MVKNKGYKMKSFAFYILSLSDFRAFALIFTALHGMHTRSSDANSVRPSVCQTRDL